MPEINYASNGKANLATTLGAIGTGLGILNNGTGLNILGGNNQNYATKDDVNNAIILAQKDSEIALLKSESNTEKKMVEVYKEVTARINADRDAQQAINAQQAVYNCSANSSINLLNNQVAQLMSLTALRIPNTSVCPGWGNVTTTPAAATGTGTGG